jgi:hypothetical protein
MIEIETDLNGLGARNPPERFLLRPLEELASLARDGESTTLCLNNQLGYRNVESSGSQVSMRKAVGDACRWAHVRQSDRSKTLSRAPNTSASSTRKSPR